MWKSQETCQLIKHFCTNGVRLYQSCTSAYISFKVIHSIHEERAKENVFRSTSLFNCMPRWINNSKLLRRHCWRNLWSEIIFSYSKNLFLSKECVVGVSSLGNDVTKITKTTISVWHNFITNVGQRLHRHKQCIDRFSVSINKIFYSNLSFV